MTTSVINTVIGESRSVARLWLEGQKLASSGVRIGVRYYLHANEALKRVELRPAPTDYQGQTFTVSKRERNGVTSPLMEIRSEIFKTLFEMGSKVRVAIREGRIVVTASHIATRIAERLKRIRDKLRNKQPLATISLFHGGGVLDSALHSGLQKSGVQSYLQVGVELEGKYLDSSLRNNSSLWREDSIAINSDVRDINLQGANTPQVELLFAGVPCTGASLSGRAKNKLAHAEEHSSAGTLFIDFLDWVKASNPAVVLVENVAAYLTTTSMTVIRSVLTSLGYVLSEEVLDASEFGSLEKRKRMCLVALTPGIGNVFDFGQIQPMRQKESCIADILEDIPLDSARWKSYGYLAAKEERDIADGKGFKRQVLSGQESHCGVIGRGYFKGRSTEIFIAHPSKDLSRLLTETEHARVKTIPEHIVSGNSETVAHEILGQSVCYCVFEAVGYLLGKTLQGLTMPVRLVADVAGEVVPQHSKSAAVAAADPFVTLDLLTA